MKTIKLYIGVLLTALMALAACTPDTFEGADPNGIPSLDGVEPVITIEEDINQVTFSLPAGMKGVMPVWILTENRGTDKEKIIYSTVDGMKRIFKNAGDYEAEFKLMNRNGMSDGTKKFTFHIANTLVNYDELLKKICGGTSGASKEWRINNDAPGHMGCGPSGTTGLEWWSAAPNDKAAWGVYENRMTFSSDYQYTFNPGESGTMYVNTGCSLWPEYNTGDGQDFRVPATEQTVAYEIESEGDDLYLTFPAHTQFPYIANDDIWNTPHYRIESVTPSELNLVIDNGGIAWHYILTSSAAAVKFKGFKYDSEYNLWKSADKHFSSIWFADSNWGRVDFGESNIDARADGFSFTMPVSNSSEWQGQVHYTSNIDLTAGTTYDFSCCVEATAPIKRMTVKICPEGDDANVLWNKNDISFEDGQGVIWFSDMAAPIDMHNLRIIFDFGGNDAGNDINISNIVLKDHANDDGTVLPTEEETPEATMDWDYDAAGNLWKAVDESSAFVGVETWFANNDWGEIAAPEWSHAGDAWDVVCSDGMGGQQWQGQFKIHTSLAAQAAKAYNFYCVVEADEDCPGITIKLTQDGDDGNFFFADRHKVEAFKPYIYKAEGVKLCAGNDAEKLMLVLDFGGSPSGTHVKISKIYFEETLDYADDANLWKAVDEGSAFGSVETWFANNDWGQIADPEWSHDGNVWNITTSEGMGGQQWQGQFKIHTTVPADTESYTFVCTVEAEDDCPGITIKLTEDGDDGNFFFADRHDVKAYVPYTYKASGVKLSAGKPADNLMLVLDFGGSPSGANVKISNIILKKD